MIFLPKQSKDTSDAEITKQAKPEPPKGESEALTVKFPPWASESNVYSPEEDTLVQLVKLVAAFDMPAAKKNKTKINKIFFNILINNKDNK